VAILVDPVPSVKTIIGGADAVMSIGIGMVRYGNRWGYTRRIDKNKLFRLI